MKMFCIYDSKAKFYDKPMFLKTKADALRGWQELANDEKTTIGKFPSDFTLFEMGEYDEVTGKITQHAAPQALGTAIEFKREAPQQLRS